MSVSRYGERTQAGYRARRHPILWLKFGDVSNLPNFLKIQRACCAVMVMFRVLYDKGGHNNFVTQVSAICDQGIEV